MSLGAELAMMGVAAAGYLTFLAAAEGARILFGLDAGVTRRLAHVAGASASLVLPVLLEEAWPCLVLGVGFALLLAATRHRGRLASIHAVPRSTWGAETFPIGIALAFWLTNGVAPAYPAAILALAVGDPAADLAGNRWGSHRLAVWGSLRSLEGSLAMLGVSTAAAWASAWLTGMPVLPTFAFGLTVGVLAAVSEAASPHGVDNVVVPVVVAGVLRPMVAPIEVVVAAACVVMLALSVVAHLALPRLLASGAPPPATVHSAARKGGR